MLAYTYTCTVTVGKPTLTLHSLPIYLEVICSISPYKSALVERYCAQPEIPEAPWPPVSNNTYVNLALIRQGNIEKAGEYARSTIQGDMDDIIADKEGIEYEKVFTSLANGTRLLIEGRPGSGKTTLVHKFSRDWALGNSKLDLKTIKLLFLVHLRGFFNDPNIKLHNIIEKYYSDNFIIKNIVEFSDK